MSPRLVPRTENPEWVRQGATIRQLREMRGVKVGELAPKLGISYAYLSNIEAGRKRLTPEMAAKAAKVLDVRQIALLRPDEFGDQAEQVPA